MKTDSQAFWKLFRPAACSVRLKGLNHEDLFAEVVENLVKAGQLPAELTAPALAALTDRERMASTGVGMGVAVPHVKLVGLERAAVSFSVQPDGLDWRAIDGAPVYLFFTVLRPAESSGDHDPERHLEMMRWIARLCRHEDFRRFAGSAKTRTELVDLLREMAAI